LDISKKQVEDMKKGDFSDEDIVNAKKTIISNINSIDDEQDTEIIYFIGQVLSEKNVSLEEYIENVNKVSKEDIVKFADKALYEVKKAKK
jgi:Zn-dependent M16 (insulinase) family peptidase